MDPQLIRGKLENGFSYYIRKVESENSRGKIQIGLVGRMGTWLEDEKQDGLAHLIEHMVLASNSSRFKEAGMHWRLDASIVENGEAFTGPHMIEYWVTLKQAALLHEYLERMRTLAWDPVILENLLDTAKVNAWGRKTILEEIRDYRRIVPEAEMDYLMFGRATGYGLENGGLEREIRNIETFDVRDLQRYYKDWYRPDMETLIVVGDIPDVKQLETRIRAMFSDLEMPENPKQKSFKKYLKGLNVDLPGTTRVLSVNNPYKDKKEGRFYFLEPSTVVERSQFSKQQYKESLLRSIYQELVNQRFSRLTSTHRYNALLNANERPSFSFRTFLNADMAYYKVSIPIEGHGTFSKARLKAIYTELERVARYGPTETELNLIKKERLQNVSEGTIEVRSYTADIQNYFIYGNPVMAPRDRSDLLKRQLSDVTAADIQKYARSIMDLPDQVLGFFLPEGESPEGLPTAQELKVWLEEVHKQDIPPWKESDFKVPEALLTQKEINRLATDIAYKETKIKTEGATRLQLKNGVTVILKSISDLKLQPGQSDIALTGISSITASDFKQRKDYVDALKSASLVQHTGAGEFNKFDLERYTSQNKLNLSFGVGSDRTTISGSAPAGKEEQLLQLLYLYLSRPGKSEEAFRDWLHREQENTNNDQSTNLTEDFFSKAKKLVEGEQQEYMEERPVSGEELSRIDPESAYQRFQQLYSQGNLTLVFTGNFNKETMIPLLQRYLGNLKGKAPEKSELKEAVPEVKETAMSSPFKTGVDTTWYHNQEDKFYVYMGWSGKITQPEDILKLELLESMIGNEMVGTTFKLGFYQLLKPSFMRYPGDHFAFFVASSETGGREVAKNMENMVRTIVAKYRQTLVSKEELENRKEALKSKYKNGYAWESQSPAGMGAYLLEIEQGNAGPRTEARQLLKMLKEINPEAVRETAKKYLSEEKVNLIRSLPEKDSDHQ
ncbi:M16 family metallopeptidase [Sinomicrobium pectinilyticum]|nr:insulinase family protein [Sinomicrobium pectinilyticum]